MTVYAVSCCSVWHHLKCSGLSKTEFENHTKNKNLYWSCPDCVVYRCGKCAKVIGKKQECIFCDCCNKWLHKKCSLLETNIFETLGDSNEPWFCWDCLKNNISCISLDSTKIQRLFGTLSYLKVVVSLSVEPVTGITANPKVD